MKMSGKFVVNGGIKMPIGFRFHPTDEELVVHYLKRKALNLPLPASVIPDFDVFQTDPWSFPAGDFKEKYFFSSTTTTTYGYGNDSNKKRKRVVGSSGYWKPVGKEKPILSSASGSNQVVGMRKAFIFCQNKKPSNETQTRWLLYQYRLVGPTVATQMLEGDWLVFRMFQRKRKAKKHGVVVNSNKSHQSQTSSSGITEVCSNELDEEVESSGFINATCYPNSCMRN